MAVVSGYHLTTVSSVSDAPPTDGVPPTLMTYWFVDG